MLILRSTAIFAYFFISIEAESLLDYLSFDFRKEGRSNTAMVIFHYSRPPCWFFFVINEDRIRLELFDDGCLNVHLVHVQIYRR